VITPITNGKAQSWDMNKLLYIKNHCFIWSYLQQLHLSEIIFKSYFLCFLQLPNLFWSHWMVLKAIGTRKSIQTYRYKFLNTRSGINAFNRHCIREQALFLQTFLLLILFQPRSFYLLYQHLTPLLIHVLLFTIISTWTKSYIWIFKEEMILLHANLENLKFKFLSIKIHMWPEWIWPMVPLKCNVAYVIHTLVMYKTLIHKL